MKISKPIVLFWVVFGIMSFSKISIGQNKYTVNIEQPDPVEAPSILSVTVTKENKTEVFWEQKENENISFFKIYRNASNSTEGWTLIGKVIYSAGFKFTDLTSFPNFRSYNYKISSVDNCGNEFNARRIHKSIKLTLELSRENAFVLNWSAYEGFDVEKYNVYRGLNIDSLQLFRSFHGNVFSFRDYEFADKKVFYQVEALAKPAFTKSIPTVVNARSNFVSTGLVLTLSDSANADKIQIYPNPLTINSIVSVPPDGSKTYRFILYNLNGQSVISYEVNSNEFELERGSLKEGFYILQISGLKTYRKKIIIAGN